MPAGSIVKRRLAQAATLAFVTVRMHIMDGVQVETVSRSGPVMLSVISNYAVCITAHAITHQAGYLAVDEYVRSGMVIGLGTGSTAYFAVERVGQLLANGKLKDIVAVPTSERTRAHAAQLSIPLATLDEHPALDVAIDGADTVDRGTLALVKGGGGALLREKIVEVAAKKLVVIVDESKLSEGLGPHFDLPVEIIQFCQTHIRRQIEGLPSLKGCKANLRMPYVTDNGNYIADLKFDAPIADPSQAAAELSDTVGVVEHGLFLDMASVCIIAGKDGVTTTHAPGNPKKRKDAPS
ncbi:chloroplast ribulose phosphate isomerase [Tribonema minus]|uniref:ribose-5-phosphate isomerase n=1 Tax=Tribonema minus TaxID=303371 RepID=A0A835YQR3_9STRA|nr:chloroplast ribulose phosphate isomerase [Tribonema minus]